jgi:hypothetical protein
MSLLGIGLFQGNAYKPGLGNNAPPAPQAVELHFDLSPNTAPTGSDLAFVFEVPSPA